jgi:hypothetical protein
MNVVLDRSYCVFDIGRNQSSQNVAVASSVMPHRTAGRSLQHRLPAHAGRGPVSKHYACSRTRCRSAVQGYFRLAGEVSQCILHL